MREETRSASPETPLERFANPMNEDIPAELVIKNRPEWIRASLANKSQYQKKCNESVKNNDGFWKRD